MEAVEGRIADRGAAPAVAVICLSLLGRPRPVSLSPAGVRVATRSVLPQPRAVPLARYSFHAGLADWVLAAQSHRPQPLELTRSRRCRRFQATRLAASAQAAVLGRQKMDPNRSRFVFRQQANM